MRKTNLLAAALVAMTGLVVGCADKVGDIDRTQPNLLDKEIFEGTWYIKQTVVDVPPTSAAAFVGAGGDMEMIRWEFTQDYLVAYRAYELVPGSNQNADHENAEVGDTPVNEGHEEGRNQEFKENPIMAYPAEYVDVVRQYNPRTGEQTNVIAENNFDREWHERDYVRVNWSSPKVANFNMFKDANSAMWSTASYWVQDDELSRDAFKMERDESGVVNYIDFTDRVFMQPSLYSCIYSMSWYGGRVGDCTGDEIRMRTSLLKVDEERELEYESLEWDDRRQGEFGYFRTERNTWNRDRGATWSGKLFIGNRHDIWQKSYEVSRDAEGELVRDLIPPDQREFRPITYTLSENYPEDLIPITEEIAGEWDASFKATAAAARGTDVATVESDLMAQTGNSCLFCIDYNEDNSARNGDIRHNFIYWVDDNQQRGPLGYGPSFAHPETGRIVSGNAYVYGAAIDTYAQRGVDMVRLINGELTDEEFQDASYIQDQILRARSNFDPRMLKKLEGLEIDNPGIVPQAPEQREAFQQKLDVHLMGIDAAAHAHDLDVRGLPQARHGYMQAQFKKIEDTPLEATLMTDELVRGIAPEWKPGQPLTDDIVEQARLTNWATPQARANTEREMRIFAERNNLWLADFNDPALVGLAREVAQKGWDEAQIRQHIREQTYKAVMLHEIGHTIGLRHNFGGSADPLNYMDEYWQIRPNTFGILEKQQLSADDLMRVNCTLVDAENQAACEEQTNARMIEYQQTSIMDYGARFNSDYQGLGKYDWAAIAAGYGDLVEVFEDDVSEQLNNVALDNNGGSAAIYLDAFAGFMSPLDGTFADVIHYVNFPSVFGSVENMAKRKYIPRSEYEAIQEEASQTRRFRNVRVPYFACYDEYRDSTARCHTWDQGADHYEITQGFIQGYKEYYLFNNYQQDRIGFSAFGVFNRVLGRYFFPIQNMYQNWIFGRSQLDSLGGFYSQMGMLEGFETIYKAMSGHLYGTYEKNNQGVWEWAGYENQAGAADTLYVPRGDGRRLFTTFDRDSGYNWINRPSEAGVFFEQLAAIMALTSAQSGALAVGQDAAADVLAFSLPYNLVFGEEINNLFSGTFTENFDIFAPRMVDGRLVTPSPIFAGEGDDEWDSGERVAYQVAWGSRLYSALYGMAMLNVNFDVTFARRNQVAIGGSGDEVNPGAGFETVRFSDPVSGREFTAWRPQTSEPGIIYPAAQMVDKLRPLGDQYRGLQEKLALLPESTDPDSEYAKTQTELRNVEFDIQDTTRDLEILRGMYFYFGRAW